MLPSPIIIISTSTPMNQQQTTISTAPNGLYTDLNPKLFEMNMTEEKIQELLKLKSRPTYKTDAEGYVEFQPGFSMGNRFIFINTLGRGILFLSVYNPRELVQNVTIINRRILEGIWSERW